ncbi:MAG: tol-pal system protein YbgF [Proteobacteria bacterium]|nr:tol-pal system protein YbgF [Pseudomonadota bacterium]
MRQAGRAVLCGVLMCVAGSAAQAALFDDDEARARTEALRKQVTANQQALDEKLARIESAISDRSALMDLAGQIEALKGDLARMRGQVEVLLNQAETADKRQKDLYLDIDTRLRKLEKDKEASAAPAADAPPSPEETKAYEAALNQFKLGNYSLAISALQGLQVTYPSSKLAPNAQYWIGMAHAAQRDYKNAILAQQKVVTAWPNDAKAPDAMLNIANSQEALGDRRGALKTLEGLLEKYPASQAAASAKQRLQKR